MIKWTGLLLLMFLCSRAISQNTILLNSKLSGTLRDSLSGQPLEKATIRLTSPARDSWKKETVTRKDGSFSIPGLAEGGYILTAEFVGYNSLLPKYILIGANTDTVLDIYLSVKVKSLQSIVVTSSRSLVENKTDRLVYNVDKDVTSQGAMATDVLRKIPQVTVDINGNVELLGNPSVRFLINGKPSAVFGSSIADALQSIPASQIQSIEVMSSPGARYDASGTGGIINIILKKNRAKGFSGAVNMTAGSRLENGALNLNYKKNNIGITGYFSGSTQLKSRTISGLERSSTDTATKNNYYLEQNGNSDFTRYGYRSGLGIDWDITTRDNLALSFGHYHFGNTNNGATSQHNSEKDKYDNLILDEFSNLYSDTRFNNYSFEAGLDYKRKLRKEKQELSLSYNYSMAHNNSPYLQSLNYITNDSIFGGSSSKNPGKDYLSTIALDYTDPVSKHFLLETGVKAEIESLVSNSDVYTFSPVQYTYVFDDKQSYASTFRRQVYAGYVSGNFSIFKLLDVMAGARIEHTINNASYSKNQNTNIPDYNNFGPSLILSHTFNNQQVLKFSYACRLERPDYRDLNPFVNLSDPHNINTGNPFIKPEIGNDFQLGYNQSFGKDNNLNIVLLYNYNNPDIKSYTTFYPSYKVGDSVYTDVNVTMRDNIAAEHRWGLNISSTVTILSKLNIRANIQLYDRTTKNIYSTPPLISGFEYRGNMNVNYPFSHGLVAEAFGNYNSGIKWQGRRAAFSSYTFALRQQLFKGKGSLGLTAVNAFGKYLSQKSTQIGTGFTGTSLLQIPYRSFGINFMYKFGSIRISKPKEEENLLTKPPPGEN
ncbi:MAG: TonB-dependent receptor [Bacteroidota bacterium]|nr:TonB-dependent receptor [Bacteroidota bacterium]